MPQKTDINTLHVNNSIINSKTMLTGAVANPESIEQSKTIVESTNPRRLSTATDRTAGMVSNPSRSNSRQTKNATIPKVDDPVGNFRFSIDESVISALLDCAYADVKHEVLGYLGGTCDVDRSDNTIVCRVSQFVASERIVTSLLTDEVQEIPNSRENAIKLFAENSLEFVGWYRSNFQSNSNSIPTQYDIKKHTAIQSKFPNSAGFIVNTSTTSCPSIGSKGTNINGLVNSISVFRTFESPNTNGDINSSIPPVSKTKNGKILKGKGKANLKANKVSFIVNRQMYMCPNVMQQLSCALMTVLRETRQTYAGQVLECENRNGQRIFVDSQYESFLMNFLRKSVLQFDRSIDQDFRTLSLAKLHVKSLISKRINDTLAISQNGKDTNDSEKISKRRKLDKLIEKLVTQRMDKCEKEMEKLIEGEKDDAAQWLNSKSQNDVQTIGDPTIDSSKSESQKTEQLNQKTFKRESFSLPQSNNTKPKENVDHDQMDIDVVVIDSDSTSEIDIEESGGIPSKSLLRKASLDSSKLNPISKRLKPPVSESTFSTNGSSSSAQSNKNHLLSSFLSKSSNFSTSPSTLITVPNNNSLGSAGQPTTNGSQYSQINYQYSSNISNGFRPFHNGPEELNATLRPSTTSSSKAVNVSQSSGIYLPSIQGLLEISNRASMQPLTPSPLPNVVVVDPNSTIVQHSSFPLLSFQNSHYYSYSQQAISRTTPPPNSSPIQHHLHIINNTSTGSASTNPRHYIPIAPSPITTTTGSSPSALQTSTSASSIYTNNTTNHLTFPAAESDYQWKL